jgi:hypothetical protein
VIVVLGSVLAIAQLADPLPYRWTFLILVLPAAGVILDRFRLARIVSLGSTQPLPRLIAGAVFALIGIPLPLRLNTSLILPALTVILGAATVVRALVNGRRGGPSPERRPM